MAKIQHDNKTYIINDEINVKYNELIKLILNTESMNDDERQYWFDIMPSMTDSQIDRLFDILNTEKKKLESLELKYQKEIKQLNEKHLIEWQDFQMKDSKKKIAKAESEDINEEAEDILNMLNDI